ncbi:hypothetical protein [Sulfitobacter aestuariivivens]|uniref:Uncharacterized protein n=1 Tax=Sulfitobacter aestuariivivens TaxID=2766981 RepID=A0A927D7Z3_9RHOB|nr:hypothetical protein [Sulfitobacter aestuariivivens]MBD3665818.1 hypothetical protein [Sulfitobacter aestuariivivens]
MHYLYRRYRLWILYLIFLICAVLFGSREGFLSTNGDNGFAKGVVLAIYLAFLAFSLYATHRENFFRSIGKINALLWGRQVGIDLYISVFLSLALIYLVEGSVLVLLAWFLPIVVFANLAILPYLLLNFAEVVGHFQL